MKVKFGLKNVHIALYDEESKSYETPFALKGAVSLSLDAEGDESSFSADNNPKYYSLFVNNGYSGSLEVALLNEEFLTGVLGQVKDQNGALIESVSNKGKNFALLFEVEGDDSNRRTVFYNCTASRPSTEASTTEDSIEVQTETIDISAGQNADGDIKASLDSTVTGYATFFESVYVKSV